MHFYIYFYSQIYIHQFMYSLCIYIRGQRSLNLKHLKQG